MTNFQFNKVTVLLKFQPPKKLQPKKNSAHSLTMHDVIECLYIYLKFNNKNIINIMDLSHIFYKDIPANNDNVFLVTLQKTMKWKKFCLKKTKTTWLLACL